MHALVLAGDSDCGVCDKLTFYFWFHFSFFRQANPTHRRPPAKCANSWTSPRQHTSLKHIPHYGARAHVHVHTHACTCMSVGVPLKGDAATEGERMGGFP